MKRILLLMFAGLVLLAAGFWASPYSLSNPGCILTIEESLIPTEAPLRRAVRERTVYDCGVTLIRMEVSAGYWYRTETRLAVRFVVAQTLRTNNWRPDGPAL